MRWEYLTHCNRCILFSEFLNSYHSVIIHILCRSVGKWFGKQLFLFHHFDDLIYLCYTAFPLQLAKHHIRATVIFEQKQYRAEVVERCPDHIKTHKVGGELNSYSIIFFVIMIICHSCPDWTKISDLLWNDLHRVRDLIWRWKVLVATKWF